MDGWNRIKQVMKEVMTDKHTSCDVKKAVNFLLGIMRLLEKQ